MKSLRSKNCFLFLWSIIPSILPNILPFLDPLGNISSFHVCSTVCEFGRVNLVLWRTSNETCIFFQKKLKWASMLVKKCELGIWRLVFQVTYRHSWPPLCRAQKLNKTIVFFEETLIKKNLRSKNHFLFLWSIIPSIIPNILPFLNPLGNIGQLPCLLDWVWIRAGKPGFVGNVEQNMHIFSKKRRSELPCKWKSVSCVLDGWFSK